MRIYYFITCFFFFSVKILFSQKIDTAIIKGTVFCARHEKEAIPNADVVFKTDNGAIVFVKTDSAGRFVFKISTSDIAKAEVTCESNKFMKCRPDGLNFLANELTYKLNIKDSSVFVCNFNLTPAGCRGEFPQTLFKKNSTDEFVYYHGVGYGTDSVKVSEDGVVEDLSKVLRDNPTIIIELSGHCSAEEKNPDQLSQARANKIKALLIKKGIEERRLITRGYGIKKLKLSNAMIAKAKTTEEKEALRQKNRRCVFKVLSWDFQKSEEGK